MTVGRGDIIRITGRNGSGKTTLLKIIAGKLTPTNGLLKSEKNLKAVYLDQNASEFVGEALTVCEQMAVGLGADIAAIESTRERELRDRITKFVARYEVGLEDKLDSFVSELSGGQRQIIALLSVLLNKANLLLLDEFTAAMDPTSTEISNNLIQKAVEDSGVTIAFVSHSYQAKWHINREIDLGEY